MKINVRLAWLALLLCCLSCEENGNDARAVSQPKARPDARGWLNWRGPHQNGSSDEKGLPEAWQVDGKNHLWSYDLSGRGTPLIVGNRLYVWGYRGQGSALREVLACLDAGSSQRYWARRYSDFISDIIYNRYSIGSPAFDPESGFLYLMTSPGLLVCLDGKGRELWQHSMMEEFGRLTFPNGRTGCPVVDGDLVIVRGITSFWGKQGPARDRFYAFDKRTGQPVWASTPGVRPRDSSFSTPVFSWWNGRRVFYCGTGCGNIVCVDARTGEPLWRFPFSVGGINASVLLHHGDKLIVIHNKENRDNSEVGRMAAVKLPRKLPPGRRPAVLGKTYELWRNGLKSFSSSPVLVGDRVYVTTQTGELASVDANTGKILWRYKLGNEQLHASPLYADGKLYIPLRSGMFFIVKPTEQGPKVLSKTKLEGACFGAPAVWNGKIYVETTKKLYCFGRKGGGTWSKGTKPRKKSSASKERPKKVPGKGEYGQLKREVNLLRAMLNGEQLQLVPSEILLRPGQSQSFSLRSSNGGRLPLSSLSSLSGIQLTSWAPFIPPAAKVKARLNAVFSADHSLKAKADPVPSAGMFKLDFRFQKMSHSVFLRGRILPDLPLKEDFEHFKLQATAKDGSRFAYPPLPWIGARFKWEVRKLDGNQVLAKTLDRILFQRATTFIGHPDMKNYTLQADVMSDGNRRIMSTVGLINQHYLIALKGNWQRLEISSNYERLKVSTPFHWKPRTWYRLKTRVDVRPDGSGLIRAKAWKRDDPEPKEWTLTVPHRKAHTQGSPGLFGFSPQSRKKVYVDNIVAVPNK